VPLVAHRRFGTAWLLLSLALGLHVTDEALTDFLSFYNPLVESLRLRLGWWPMPTFTFGVWLGGLIVAVVALTALSRLAFAGSRWMRPCAYVYGAIMLLNGLGHTVGSLYFGKLLPGLFSSPFLLVASVYLLKVTREMGASGPGLTTN